MRPQPGSLWTTAATRMVRAEKVSSFTANQVQVLDLLWQNYPGLYLGEPNQVRSKEDILLLSRMLSTNCSSDDKKERFDFLARGFEQGNMHLPGWDVPLAPVYIKVNREENFARQDRFRLLGQADEFIHTFQSSLTPDFNHDFKGLLGQILVSAILFGGLIYKKWIAPLQEAILQEHVYQEGEYAWVDMQEGKKRSSANKEGNRLTHRLVLDHLTRLLVYRFFRLNETNTNHQVPAPPWSAITAYMHQAGFSKASQPHSLDELLAWSFARYLTILPSSLVAYACGKRESTPLPPEAWLRLISGKAIPVIKHTSDDEQGIRRVHAKIIETTAIKQSDQQLFLNVLLKSMRFNKKSTKKQYGKPSCSALTESKVSFVSARRTITDFIQANKSRMSVTLQLLLYWAVRLLGDKISHKERRQKDTIKPVSIDRYLSSIGYALLRSADNLPLHKLDPQDLEAVYEQTAIRLAHNRYALNRLRQFHGFLETYYDADSFDWAEQFGILDQSRPGVSANLISSEIFQLLLKSLGWRGDRPTRWNTLHIIAALLLYRCGTRPSEIQALRLIDIQGITEYEFLIRNNRLNDIKTNSGIRRIPVSRLLLKEELNFFLAYYRKRLDEDRICGDGLFLTHPAYSAGMLGYSDLFEPIRQQLRTITKDERLRLYHLRHSCLSWADFLLQIDKISNPIQLPTGFPESEEIKSIHNLFTAMGRNESLGRKEYYLLAMLAGHSSPETTSLHYCHLADLALGLHLTTTCLPTPISWNHVAALTGVKRSVAYQLAKSINKAGTLERLVAHEADKFAAKIKHPLFLQADKLNETKHKDRTVTPMPSWDEAIADLHDDQNLLALRRSKAEWDFAAAIYESVRAMDGRQQKTARKALHYITESMHQRWGGISVRSTADARLLALFLTSIGVKPAQLILTSHAAKNASSAGSDNPQNKWATIFGVKPFQIFVGEQIPAKQKIKHMIVLRVIATTCQGHQKTRTPKMSTGFLYAFNLIYDLLYLQSNTQ